MNVILKRIAGALPTWMQQELKRLHFRHQIRKRAFATDEPEYGKLQEWLEEGDWAIDLGANVGHYTLRMSNLVGPTGRVLAFEPVSETFELLSANVCSGACRNVTLFNAAASDAFGSARMAMPSFSTGLVNFYMASLSSTGQFEVLTVPIDSIVPRKRIALVKIDVEGHELQALRGMQETLLRDHPTIIVEGTSGEVASFLHELGYKFVQLPSSPNRIFSAWHSRQTQRSVDRVATTEK